MGSSMLTRIFIALVLATILILPASAQTVRFDTNVGNIDFVLNPNNNPNLQGHVDNILSYVNAGLYDLSFINRAPEDFVLQFGGFSVDPIVAPDSFADFISIPSFAPVIVDANDDGDVDFIPDSDGNDVIDTIDAAAAGLSNTTNTISLALGGDPDTGTSSFFVNLTDNTFLDNQGFVPFASVADSSTIDLIRSLPQISLVDPTGGNLAATDIPLVNGVGVVFIERAFVLEDEASMVPVTFSTVVDSNSSIESTVSTFSSITEPTETTAPSTFSQLIGADDSLGSGPVTFSTLTPAAEVSNLSSAASSAPLLSALSSASPSQSVALQAVAVPEPPALVLALGALVLVYILKPNKIR